MTASSVPHAPVRRRGDEQRQVSAALAPRIAGPHLAAAMGVAAPRACRVLDARYDPGVRCSVLYELGGRVLLGEVRWDGGTDGAAGGRWIEELGMSVHPFPHDPALPGLAACLAPGRLESALGEALAGREGDVEVLRCRAVPVRYRPGRRCTLRVDLTLRRRRSPRVVGRRLYAKLYHDAGKAAAVFAEMRALDADPGLRAAGTFVAEAVALVPALALVAQAPLAGTPLDALLRPSRASGPALGDGVERAARALASLHSTAAVSARRRPPQEALRKLEARAGRIAGVAPSLGADMAAALGELAARAPGDGSAVLVHGDCKPSQFLLAGAGTGIVDFDHCAMADPASDVGNFLASLRQAEVRRSLRSPAHAPAASLRPLERRFARAYLDAAPASAAAIEHAGWYQAAALVRKAQRSFARSPASPLPGALARQALGCLASGPAAHS